MIPRTTFDSVHKHKTDVGLSRASDDESVSDSDNLRNKIRTLEASVKDFECFSYGLLHDLRSSMLALDGYASLLMQDCAAQLNDKAIHYVQTIHERCRRVSRLIEAHRVYAGLHSRSINCVEVDMFQLAKIASDDVLCDHCGEPPRLIVRRLPVARGDHDLLYAAWFNLIGNAVKYSSKVSEPQVELAGWDDGAESVYLVRDNGAGFDPLAAEGIFDLFTRLNNSREYPGSGVGLAIVERIVSSHGGRIWADAEPSKGATFYFALPRANVPD